MIKGGDAPLACSSHFFFSPGSEAQLMNGSPTRLANTLDQ